MNSRIDLNLSISRPSANRFLRVSRPMLLGDVTCEAGDVLEVQPPGAKPTGIMPVDPRLFQDRAQRLVDKKLATWHAGPATVNLGHSLSLAKTLAGLVERADLAPQIAAKAERATGRPQRGAM